MNSHAEYRRHSHQPPEMSYSPDANADLRHDIGHEGSRLAHAADPSLPGDQPAGPKSRRIAWARPSDLPNFTGPMVGRGIDLHSELIRRARRTPKTASRAVRRHIHQSQRSSTREEGIGL